jgi:uncharacterized glyoxalase superfamily protein PhnB
MPTIETYRKHAKQLARWHREQNYSVGERVRVIDRFRHLTDREVLDMTFPLALAQEIVAVDAGFADWAALKAGAGGPNKPARPENDAPRFSTVAPILFVRDVTAAAAFYEKKLGFAVDFLHGNPPFYGAISRDDVCLHLRFVHQPNFHEMAAREGSLIVATIRVENVKALFDEYKANEVEFAQALVKQAWGGTDFHVADPDGNVVSFVQYRPPLE